MPKADVEKTPEKSGVIGLEKYIIIIDNFGRRFCRIAD